MFLRFGIFALCFLVPVGNAFDSSVSADRNPVQGHASKLLSAAMSDQAETRSEVKAEGGLASLGPLDTCALIENSEIASVQGVEVQQTQPSSGKHGDLEISQCYYTAISADGLKNLGVYLQVIHRDSTKAGRDALKEYWSERFGRDAIEKMRREEELKAPKRTERQKAKAIKPPAHVSGIGDEAFWLASMRGGGLFVLKKDKVLRISVGSTGDERADIEKSRTLAKKALARLK